ncbi:MAG: hypothetical protein ABIP65_03480, partial [Vicinamibacterales bacterium]
RRIEASERPARVIAFPKVAAAEFSRPTSVRPWIAAAAAGLIVGLGLGQMMDFRHLGSPVAFPANRVVVSPPRPETQASAVVASNAILSEETLLAELEAAATPRYDTLKPYDEFTPHTADFIKVR